ncbi:hypothetical protein NLG97_g1715 [Lecanicillium saksenae]|uniref:Uncharacterized protein n=1 Tax=Lecanicillium saksenae TaxID=468837 RepID=A0ACC1R6E3_9HYPO|nr:hypothetical protein NLG97_g1715 [Lecanicillium saksenae]
MVKITLFATAAVMVATASARNCKAGINYCGWNLLNIGNYQSQVDAALRQKGWQVNGKNIHDTIFSCLGGPNGEITVLDWCAGNCADGGENHDDFCN